MINEMAQVVPKFNITLGNGKGKHSFSTNKSYTVKHLKNVNALTNAQINHYFTSDKKAQRT